MTLRFGLGTSLMSFFVIENQPPNIQSSTKAALGETVAQCANALVHLDEYRNDLEMEKREFLKSIWDGVGRSKMNMDRDKKRETTAVDCGVIVSGQEMATADYRIVYTNKFSCNKPSTTFEYNETKRILLLRKSRIFQLYKKEA